MENEIDTERTKQLKRWVLTINNPFWTEQDTEVDMVNNALPVVTDYYNLETVKDELNKDLFVFKYVVVKQDDKQVVVEKPYFKDYESIKKYIENLEHFKWSAFQLEQGENETPHIQAGIIFEAGKRFYTMKKYFPTAHIEQARGSNTDIRAYCTKKEGRLLEPIEIGKFSEMRSRNDIVEFLELIKLGAANATLQKLFPTLYSQYAPDKIEKFRQDMLKEEYGQKFRDVKVTYIYGKARLGKTTYIFNKYPMQDICRVNNYTKGTFENYISQKVLVLDEFTGKIDITFMNNLLDKFPVDLPARFSNRTACFSEVYIISNLHLSELYKEEQVASPEVYNAFISRMHEIIKFTGLGKWKYEKQGSEDSVQMTILSEEETDKMPW
ncbi:MAG: hypothetical protein LBN07_04905 [Christensenellaceae bacterium]|jgi:hypothetical protein|nr:hypothetical protein [Christensenellaceae bacterium]